MTLEELHTMCSMECPSEMCSALIALLTCISAAKVPTGHSQCACMVLQIWALITRGFNLYILFYLWICWSNIFRDSKYVLISKEQLLYVPPCIVSDSMKS